MKLKLCKTCFKPFSKLNFKVYCSRTCYDNRKGFTYGGSFITNCMYCDDEVLKYKSEIRKNPDKLYCDSKCASMAFLPYRKRRVMIECICEYCLKPITKYKKILRNHTFCSLRCSSKHLAQYTKRIARSNLERYLEGKIKQNFPYLKLVESNRSVCDGLELDLYLEDIRLAIEINGPIHSRPIYGDKYFSNIKERDKRKKNICQFKEIELLCIDNCDKFTTTIGQSIWSNILKPKLLEFIPFCEPNSEEELFFEMAKPLPKKHKIIKTKAFEL